MKRPVLLASALIATGSIAGVSTAALASADTTTGTQNGVMHHMRRDNDDRGVRVEARLNQAVRDGTITEAQKTAFLNELKTLRAEHKADIHKDSTKAERQAERTKLHDELQTWATTNNFPLDKLMPHAAQNNT